MLKSHTPINLQDLSSSNSTCSAHICVAAECRHIYSQIFLKTIQLPSLKSMKTSCFFRIEQK